MQNNLLQKYIDQRSYNMPMKLISITIILAIFTTTVFSQNVSALEFVSPEQDQKALIEASVDLELTRCYTQTYMMEANRETLKTCFNNLMKFAQIVCSPSYGGMNSEKCQIVQDYVTYINSELDPSVCKSDPSRCAAPPRPVL